METVLFVGGAENGELAMVNEAGEVISVVGATGVGQGSEVGEEFTFVIDGNMQTVTFETPGGGGQQAMVDQGQGSVPVERNDEDVD